jgi:hypothetical protein
LKFETSTNHYHRFHHHSSSLTPFSDIQSMSESDRSEISETASDVSKTPETQSLDRQASHRSWRFDTQKMDGLLNYFRPSKRQFFGKSFHRRYVLLNGGAVYIYKKKTV